MLEKFKSIIALAITQHETQLNFAGLGISNADIVVLKDLLDNYPSTPSNLFCHPVAVGSDFG